MNLTNCPHCGRVFRGRVFLPRHNKPVMEGYVHVFWTCPGSGMRVEIGRPIDFVTLGN